MVAVLLRYVALAAAVIVLNFAIPRMLPGDPLDFTGEDGTNTAVAPLSVETKTRLRSYYHLDAPMVEQFASYARDLLRLDLGASISRPAPVAQLIAERLPWTLALTGIALLVATVAGMSLGVVASWKGGATERWIMAASASLASLPELLIGLGLLLVFAVSLHWFPLQGGRTVFASAFGGSPQSPLWVLGDLAAHLALPVLTLVLATTSSFVLLTAGSTRSVLRAGFLTTARAKGVSEWTVAIRHMLPNAILPIMTYIGLRIGQMLSGAIVVERIFAIPGLGLLAFEGIRARDYPVVQAVFMVGSLGVLVANLLMELIYIRFGRRYGS